MAFIEGFLYLIPWLAMAAWIIMLFYYTELMHPKIRAVQKKYDPDGDFVKHTGGMQFGHNMFRVDKKHHLCTDEFLREWDLVYGTYWKRISYGLLLVPAVILLGRVVRWVLQAAISYLTQ
jgi:hypothetical protein